MKRRNVEFKDLSSGAKFMVLFYLFTWIYFIASKVFTTGKVSVLHLSVAMFLSLLVYSQRDWGRLFAAAYSVAMAIMVGFEIYSTGINSEPTSSYMFINSMSGLIFLASSVILIFTKTGRESGR